VQPLVVALGQRVDDGHHEVAHHADDECLEDPGQQVARISSSGSRARCSSLLAMQSLLLVLQEGLERLLQLVTEQRQRGQEIDGPLDQRLIEGDDHEDLLDVHLDHRLANQRGSEERPEWHQEVAAGDSCQIEQGIGNLQGTKHISY